MDVPTAEIDERRDKLPKWAQRELSRLESDLAHATAKLTAGPEGSNTFADPYINPQPLGFSPTIEFRLTGGKIRVRITDDGELDINGDTTIVFLPRATNSAYIKADRNA